MERPTACSKLRSLRTAGKKDLSATSDILGDLRQDIDLPGESRREDQWGETGSLLRVRCVGRMGKIGRGSKMARPHSTRTPGGTIKTVLCPVTRYRPSVGVRARGPSHWVYPSRDCILYLGYNING